MLRIARPSQARASQRSLLSFVTATCLLSASVIPAVAVPTAQANQAKASQAAQASNTTQISNTVQATQSAPATYNRFIITYTDEAKNAASTDATADQIDWSAAAGTQQATWTDALYAGITSDVQSIDELLNIKDQLRSLHRPGCQCGHHLRGPHPCPGAAVHERPERELQGCIRVARYAPLRHRG
ncbi:hypothetical protein [Rothia mucilaginosa]|uniref:hypothetical protein n=1 Tax=Rothia mucilaginosa TaxID=43675 RepID=UPI001A626068|nr:hypothetical protein [Rothia mucilaginosa]VTY02144.1 Uncharacterised protein [Rothia mucilaginosa]